MVAVGSVVFVLPLHPALRESEDDDADEMLDRLSEAESSANLDLWIALRKSRWTSRIADVH
jgi:hypothetical protein